MDTFYEIKPGLLRNSALALGFFDGVHPGHQEVIGKAVQEAQRLGAVPAVVTFKEHPRALTLGKSPPLLTPIDERLRLFEQQGVHAALVLSFTEELCRLDPEEYVRTVLVECMGAKSLSVGFNHRFGRNRIGDPELLRVLGEKYGYTVHVATPVQTSGLEVSSSLIREVIREGRVDEAAKLLSRRYCVRGEVIHGDGRGNKIGFPTANLNVPEEQVLPASGVYSAVAVIDAKERQPAVVNIGFRPTLTEGRELTVEAHLLDYKADLYGRMISLEFVKMIREERKFSGLDELVAQIQADCKTAKSHFSSHPELLQPAATTA